MLTFLRKSTRINPPSPGSVPDSFHGLKGRKMTPQAMKEMAQEFVVAARRAKKGGGTRCRTALVQRLLLHSMHQQRSQRPHRRVPWRDEKPLPLLERGHRGHKERPEDQRFATDRQAQCHRGRQSPSSRGRVGATLSTSRSRSPNGLRRPVPKPRLENTRSNGCAPHLRRLHVQRKTFLRKLTNQQPSQKQH